MESKQPIQNEEQVPKDTSLKSKAANAIGKSAALAPFVYCFQS
jgi:hypothetical protein